MASIRKQRSKWQAQIRVAGIKPITRSFEKKSDATRWARTIEGQIAIGAYVDPRAAERTTIADIIDNYQKARAEDLCMDQQRRSRLRHLGRSLSAFSIAKLSTHYIAAYRDSRRQVVSDTTVAHELALLRHLLHWAKDEMGIPMPQGIPRIPMPRIPRGRTRRPTKDELDALFTTVADDIELHVMIQLAIETGMRRSELVNIQHEHIDPKKCVLLIPETKTGEPRTIPLTRTAASILEEYLVEKRMKSTITATRLSQKFALACSKAEIKGLRLHDLRHEAISRFVERGLSLMEVSAISGHKTLSMLARYSHPDPAVIALKLHDMSENSNRATAG